MELQAACCSRQQFVTSGSNFGDSHLLTCLEATTVASPTSTRRSTSIADQPVHESHRLLILYTEIDVTIAAGACNEFRYSRLVEAHEEGIAIRLKTNDTPYGFQLRFGRPISRKH
jgi:hypothetical protein